MKSSEKEKSSEEELERKRARERDKGRTDGEVVNEDCIAVATRLIGFHFVFLPCRFSPPLPLSHFFSPSRV